MIAGSFPLGLNFPVHSLCVSTDGKQIRDRKKSEFNLNLSHIAIGRCSVGSHLSTVITHMCHNASMPLIFQLVSVSAYEIHVFNPNASLRADQPYLTYN